MTATATIIAALNQANGSASSKAFLAAVAEGEGGTTFTILFGGTMWTGSMDAFPPWTGVRLSRGSMTHAAGAFQFEPASYAAIAKVSGRMAFEPQDQIQNAWDLASQVFGGMIVNNLHAALVAGDLLLIPAYLGKIWPGGCDSGFPKRFVSNLNLVSTTPTIASNIATLLSVPHHVEPLLTESGR
jgi:muramidase (phage lysozyme)